MNPYDRALLSLGCFTIGMLPVTSLYCQGIHQLWGSAYAGGNTNNGTVFNVQQDGSKPSLNEALICVSLRRWDL